MQRIGRGFIGALIGCLTVLAVAATAHCGDTYAVAGDVSTVLIGAAAGGVPLLLGDREGMVQLVKSAALDVAATMALKYTIKERRPDGSDDHSFPSAHSSVAFTSAEFLRKRYGWEYGIPAYGVASFVAVSRVAAHKHYAADVLAGAAIGIASSYLFTTPNLRMNLQTEVAPGYYGVRLTKAW
jgi:membrane-associated phospholipid phosphatase